MKDPSQSANRDTMSHPPAQSKAREFVGLNIFQLTQDVESMLD